MLSILPACALAEMVNVFMLYHYCQLSVVQYQHTLESATVSEANFPLLLLSGVTQPVFVPEIRGDRRREGAAIQTQGLVLAGVSGCGM